jgi:hypothetical protein
MSIISYENDSKGAARGCQKAREAKRASQRRLY